MSLLRLVGACFWVVCGWFGGDYFCVQTQNHLDELDKTIELLRRLKQEISCRRTDLNLLYPALHREGTLDFCSIQAESFQTLAAPVSFSEAEKICFQECFSGLGHAEAVQECDRLELYLQRFTQFRSAAEQAAQTRLFLAHKLGLGAGLAAAILFL